MTVLISECETWPQEVSIVTGKIHKIIVENMIVHSDLKIPAIIEVLFIIFFICKNIYN